MVGTNLSEIDTELGKIALNIAPAKLIEEEKVREIIGGTRQDTVFAFIDELFYKKHVDAAVMLNDLLTNGQNEVGIVTLIARHLRILQQTQAGIAEGLRGQSLAQKVGVSPYFLTKYLQQANLWKPAQLEALLVRLAELDRQLKSSNLPSDYIS